MEFSGNATVENNLCKKLYIVMNKPVDYVCSYVSDRHKTVYDLLSPELQALMKEKRGARLHTVGRLDCDTSGLLIFTNDGNFSNELTRPENHIKKTYRAVLKFAVSEEEQKKMISVFAGEVILPPEKKAPEQKVSNADLKFLSENEALLTISEGKFHQVRRMFQAVNNEVIALKRVSIGNFTLSEDLLPGNYKIFENFDFLY